jgi:hypothetical protein
MGISIQDIIGGGTLGAVSSIIKDFKGDPNAKNALSELVEQNTATFKLADLEAQVKLNDIAGQNVRADAQSASWLAKNSRPFFIFGGSCMIFFNYMIPTITSVFHYPITPVSLPDWFWKTFTAGFLGYVAGRSVEKVTGSDN